MSRDSGMSGGSGVLKEVDLSTAMPERSDNGGVAVDEIALATDEENAGNKGREEAKTALSPLNKTKAASDAYAPSPTRSDVSEEHRSPKIEKAWDYFYRHTLPRYAPKEDDPKDFRKMEPGEDGGHLYSILGTPLSQLGDFGLGVGLFFQLLAVLGVLLLLVGIINAWSIDYMGSAEYGGEQSTLKLILQGSAACKASEWACLDGTCSDGHWRRPCELSATQGYLDFAGILTLIFVLWAVGHAQDLSAEQMDEAEQTAQDYSVVIQDPDNDATDPEEWRAFFASRFGHVSYVTVAIDNGELLEALAARRSVLHQIHVAADTTAEERRARDTAMPLTRQESLPQWKAFVMKMGFMRDLEAWHEQLVAVETTIAKFTAEDHKFHAVKVFVTFDTEEAQRECLRQMTTGIIPAMTEQASAVPDDVKFRGTNVLKVDEAPEPNEVQWRNLQYPLVDRAKKQAHSTLFATITVILAGLTVWGFKEIQPGWAALVISANNTILPIVMKLLNASEPHHTDSASQASLMFKTVLAQWMNTAFIIYITTAETLLLDYTYIKQVSAILWADAFTSPIILFLDIPGRAAHYILAKTSHTQLQMNSYFQGTAWFLAERYAAMIKTVFVMLFFSALFPAGYFISSIAMLASYWACKYCLFRVWKSPPQLDDSLTKLTRGYIALAILIKIIVTLHIYAGWPFDNICITDATVSSVSSSASELYGVASGDPVWEHCSQAPGHVWLVGLKSWMTDDQKALVRLYRVFALICTIAFATYYFGEAAAFSAYRLFRGINKPVGDSQNIAYSEVRQIQAYVPQIVVPTLMHPLLATDLSTLDTEHIAWTGDYHEYNLCSEDDLRAVPAARRSRLFSPCVHYPPPKRETVGGAKEDGERPAESAPVTPPVAVTPQAKLPIC